MEASSVPITGFKELAEDVSAIAADGYDEEGFCEGYEWVDGELKANTGEGAAPCSHTECNGYQPATLETLDYDFNDDGKTDENDKAYKITNAGQFYWFAAYVNQGGDNIKARFPVVWVRIQQQPM